VVRLEGLDVHKPHFPSWLKIFCIGSLEIWMRPPNGRSSSRIRKRALATERAETA